MAEKVAIYMSDGKSEVFEDAECLSDSQSVQSAKVVMIFLQQMKAIPFLILSNDAT